MVAPDTRILLEGLGFPESTRWHDGRLWCADWATQEIVAVDLDGKSEVVTEVPSGMPISVDWLPDGRMLVVSGSAARLLRQEPDGSLVTHADLGTLGEGFNEIVVDGRGNAFVNGATIAVVTPDGAARTVARDIAFGNGMAVTPDGSTLIVAESHASRLSAFDIAPDGGLSGRRVWADVGEAPDGICIDAEGAVWYATVPGKRCVRVREGGEVLQTVEADRGCFACMLGGPDGTTLFVATMVWRGWEHRNEDPGRTGQILTADAPVPHAGRP